MCGAREVDSKPRRRHLVRVRVRARVRVRVRNKVRVRVRVRVGVGVRVSVRVGVGVGGRDRSRSRDRGRVSPAAVTDTSATRAVTSRWKRATARCRSATGVAPSSRTCPTPQPRRCA